ncbi:unnamed protein product [Scytosiphon promiscuus]
MNAALDVRLRSSKGTSSVVEVRRSLRHAVALVSIKSGAGIRAFCSSSVGISQQSGVKVQLVTPMRVKRTAKGEKLVGGHVFLIIFVGQGKVVPAIFSREKIEASVVLKIRRAAG